MRTKGFKITTQKSIVIPLQIQQELKCTEGDKVFYSDKPMDGFGDPMYMYKEMV